MGHFNDCDEEIAVTISSKIPRGGAAGGVIQALFQAAKLTMVVRTER